MVKNLPANAGDTGSIPGLGRSPEGGHGNPPQYSCLDKPHGQRSLVGYSLWGHKELDTAEAIDQTHKMTFVKRTARTMTLALKSAPMWYYYKSLY